MSLSLPIHREKQNPIKTIYIVIYYMELYNQQNISVCNHKSSDKENCGMERQIVCASVEGGYE